MSRPDAPDSPEDRETMRRDFERGVYEREKVESETPEDVAYVLGTIPKVPTMPNAVEKDMAYLPSEMRLLRDYIRSLERRLSLAQTEIKGYIMVEDELKAEIERERMRVVGCSVAALGNWKEGDSLHADYDCAAIRDVAKLRVKYDEAQARIAELEKELAELHREWEVDILAATDLRQDAARYRFIRNLLAIEDVERLIADGNPTPDEQESLRTDDAIDLALKSRA